MLNRNKPSQGEIDREREGGRTDLDIIFFVFYCNSRTYFLAGSFIVRSLSGTPSQSSPTMDALIFSRLRIVVANVQLTAFPLFYPTFTTMAFLLELLSLNQNPLPFYFWYIFIFNPGVCYDAGLDLMTPPQFIFPFVSHLYPLLLLSLSLSLSLSVWLPWTCFIYVLSFPLSYSRPVNQAGKQFTFKAINQNP